MRNNTNIISTIFSRTGTRIKNRKYFQHIRYLDKFNASGRKVFIKERKSSLSVWSRRFLFNNIIDVLPWILIGYIITHFLLSSPFQYPYLNNKRVYDNNQKIASIYETVESDYVILNRIGKRFLVLGLDYDAFIQFEKAYQLNKNGKNAIIGLGVSTSRLFESEPKWCEYSERLSNILLTEKYINEQLYCEWSKA